MEDNKLICSKSMLSFLSLSFWERERKSVSVCVSVCVGVMEEDTEKIHHYHAQLHHFSS